MTASRRATAVGAVAVLLWSLLALFTVWSGRVPPFQLTALCLAVVPPGDDLAALEPGADDGGRPAPGE